MTQYHTKGHENSANCACFPPLLGERAGVHRHELSPAAGPHWQALNLNPNPNLARLRFLEIKSKITIKIGKKPFRLNSMAVPSLPPHEARRTSNIEWQRES